MARISSSLGLTIGPFGSVDTRFSHCGFEGGAGGEGALTGATGGRTGGGGGGGAPSSSSPGPEVRNFSLAADSCDWKARLSSSCACSRGGTVTRLALFRTVFMLTTLLLLLLLLLKLMLLFSITISVLLTVGGCCCCFTGTIFTSLTTPLSLFSFFLCLGAVLKGCDSVSL